MHHFFESFLREARFPRSQAGSDDILDACACSWTAARIFRGGAISFPADVPVDAKGLAWQSSLNRRAIGTATSLAHWGLPFKAHLR